MKGPFGDLYLNLGKAPFARLFGSCGGLCITSDKTFGDGARIFWGPFQ